VNARKGGEKIIFAIFQASPLIKKKLVINANWMTPILVAVMSCESCYFPILLDVVQPIKLALKKINILVR